MKLGFLGLGFMGKPMALNLARHFQLTVWNRSPSKYPAFLQAGCKTAETPAQVARESDIIFTMLFNSHAIQSILDAEFLRSLRGKILVNTSSVPVDFSHSLDKQVRQAGGSFIEMPVSGSKVPAERGELVGMLAGDRELATSLQPVVKHITTAAVYCGPIGMGLKTKYAVNLYLITTTAGLAESMNLARAQGLDVEAFVQVLDAGPMASPYSKLKLAKMLAQDWSPQAAIKDCFNITQLITSAAKAAQTQSPFIQLCETMYGRAIQSGIGDEDMIALTKTLAEPLRKSSELLVPSSEPPSDAVDRKAIKSQLE
ncbi:putative NAD binding NADP oxidoreductase coenzyme F420-dependent [Camillea tinctor]|nr:putative NAD binding NADP oxidoreductase coenzyme F420-dependent [Camillea tinctor]